MEVRDGFIVGIFNYCDSWCERCQFTSRCRLFADAAQIEASLDPQLQAIVDAPPLPQDIPPPQPRWMQEDFEAMNEASTARSKEVNRILEIRDRAAKNEPIYARAMAYSSRVHMWREAHRGLSVSGPTDPWAVIGWFHTLIAPKIGRALEGRASDDPSERDWPADHDGSAKVALDGIDQSIAAWDQLGTRGLVPIAEAHDFIVDLMWQRDELERLFPKARGFVRAAFDEPDEVAKLLAAEKKRA
jgi:hypothetical protein